MHSCKKCQLHASLYLEVIRSDPGLRTGLLALVTEYSLWLHVRQLLPIARRRPVLLVTLQLMILRLCQLLDEDVLVLVLAQPPRVARALCALPK